MPARRRHEARRRLHRIDGGFQGVARIEAAVYDLEEIVALRSGPKLLAFLLAFGEGRLAFIRRCVAAGYAVFDGDRLALTPEGMLVQNSILTELLP